MEHRGSKLHRARLAEVTDLVRLAGLAQKPRELTLPNRGCLTPGSVPSRQEMRSHRGADLDTLGSRAAHRLAAKGVVINKRHYTGRSVANVRLTLAAISYSGQGKYGASTRCVKWSDLAEAPGPMVAAGPEAPPLGWAPPPFGNMPMGPGPALFEEGWWPVTLLEFSEEGEFQSSLGTAVNVITQTICVVCIYQWGWPTPYAWWVSMTPM